MLGLAIHRGQVVDRRHTLHRPLDHAGVRDVTLDDLTPSGRICRARSAPTGRSPGPGTPSATSDRDQVAPGEPGCSGHQGQILTAVFGSSESSDLITLLIAPRGSRRTLVTEVTTSSRPSTRRAVLATTR